MKPEDYHWRGGFWVLHAIRGQDHTPAICGKAPPNGRWDDVGGDVPKCRSCLWHINTRKDLFLEGVGKAKRL